VAPEKPYARLALGPGRKISQDRRLNTLRGTASRLGGASCRGGPGRRSGAVRLVFGYGHPYRPWSPDRGRASETGI
jgi:hypothetical protein